VTFAPDIAVAVVVPVAIYPLCVSVGWFHVGSGNPDVAVAVPAVIAGVPGPVGMFVRRRGNNFMGSFRRTDANDNLGSCNACGEAKGAGNSGEEFLHRAISFLVLKHGTPFSAAKLSSRTQIFER
jgi:hypothetical protein